MNRLNDRSSSEPASITALQWAAGMWFSNEDVGCGVAEIAVDALPHWANRLLVHDDHMTTRLQDFHGGPIELIVLDETQQADEYRRLILLKTASTGAVVELGMCRIDFRFTPAAVREEVLDRRAPLGDILIRHNVLRRVEPRSFWKFPVHTPLLRHTKSNWREAFGRVGVIHCNGSPAIDLLEIVGQ